jgi:anti-sigma regulatory factor (Ser/Thr protein kinase)
MKHRWCTLAEFSVPSASGHERQAMDRVALAVEGLGLSPERLERLKTAVAEAVLNAMEHGNQYRPKLPVTIRVLASHEERAVSVQVTHPAQASRQPLPEPETPDLDAKLSGRQSPRGWGFFLIKKMVDGVHVADDDAHHTVELFLYLEGGQHA